MMMNKKFFKATVFGALAFLIFTSCSNGSKKWINTNIEGNILPEKPSEKDDFYQAINYENLKNMPLKDGAAVAGGTANMRELLAKQISQMAQETSTTSAENNSEKQKLFALYNKCLDWQTRDTLGVQPLLPFIKKIQEIKSISEFETLFNDQDILFFFPVGIDLKTNNGFYYTPTISINFMFGKNLDEYKEFYKSMLTKCGFSQNEANSIVQQAYNFEKNYNTNILQNNVLEASSIYYNNIKREYTNFPLAAFLHGYGVPNLNYFIKTTQELKTFDSLFTDENLEAIKALSLCKLLLSGSRLLDRECFEYASKLNQKLLGSSLSFSEYGAVNHILDYYTPQFLGKIWSLEFCDDELIADVENLSYEIIEEYKKQISTWDWLGTYSRTKLIELLNNLKVIAGYSSFYDYSDFELSDTLCDSIIQLVKYETNTKAKNCYKDLYIYEWTFTPQTCNAFYSGTNNSINILAGYIYGINYDMNAPLEEKLGVLGSVIAHEISHSFSNYDERSNIIQILNATDHKALREKLNTMADYFSTFEVIDGKNCNGQKCIGEIGADIFGMATLLNIASGKPDFDYKLFFESYAKRNFAKYTENLNRIYFETDPHPSDFLRTNAIVQQFDEFYSAFDIKRGDGMYLAPEKRFKL